MFRKKTLLGFYFYEIKTISNYRVLKGLLDWNPHYVATDTRWTVETCLFLLQLWHCHDSVEKHKPRESISRLKQPGVSLCICHKAGWLATLNTSSALNVQSLAKTSGVQHSLQVIDEHAPGPGHSGVLWTNRHPKPHHLAWLALWSRPTSLRSKASEWNKEVAVAFQPNTAAKLWRRRPPSPSCKP